MLIFYFPTYLGHKNWVLCIAWSPDGKHLVSGSKAGELQCWDPQTGKPSGNPLIVKSLNLNPLSYLVIFLVDIWMLLWFSFEPLTKFNPTSGVSLWLLSGLHSILSQNWNPLDGHRLTILFFCVFMSPMCLNGALDLYSTFMLVILQVLEIFNIDFYLELPITCSFLKYVNW